MLVRMEVAADGSTSKLTARVGAAFEVTNLVRDAGGLDAMMGTQKSFFNKVEFGTYLGEAFIELASLVVEVSELLYFGKLVPVVKFGNSIAEGVKGWVGSIE